MLRFSRPAWPGMTCGDVPTRGTVGIVPGNRPELPIAPFGFTWLMLTTPDGTNVLPVMLPPPPPAMET